MATELLREKISQLTSQVNSAKVETYFLDLQIKDDVEAQKLEKSEINDAVKASLKQTGLNAMGRKVLLQIQLANRVDLLAELEVEQKAIDAQTAAQAETR